MLKNVVLENMEFLCVVKNKDVHVFKNSMIWRNLEVLEFLDSLTFCMPGLDASVGGGGQTETLA